ncbi:MAG: FHA domain-containing protein [Blastocatellia bacterium]
MTEVKLKFGGREFSMGSGITTIGRTEDNFISFPEDSNVSRYHAEIEKRGEEYCLIDLNSSNGTTVNGQKLSGEAYLSDGDRIVLGGSSEIVVEFTRKEKEAADTSPETAVEPVSDGAALPAFSVQAMPPVAQAIPPVSSQSTGSGKMLLIAGGVCGLAVVCVAAVVIIYYLSGSSCDATAVITSPEPGDTISTTTEIAVDIKNGGCVAKAVYFLDGVEFASSSESPFAASINPKNHGDLADGVDHSLSVVLFDEDGNAIPQTNPVLLAFETREIAKPSPEPEVGQTGTQTNVPAKGKEVSLIDIQEMTKRLAKQFPSGGNYNFSNKQFLQEIQKKTAEYAQEGYFERASKYRDAINVAYVREQNLDAPLGYMLAMSRSKFDPAKQGKDEGLWRMSNDFVTANGYNGLCGSETIADPSQNCAAKASALYMKAIVFGVFDGDVILSAAVFGKSSADAGTWKSSLPANRTDVWSSIKTPQEREQLVRFFAAGIVAENPHKFGLKKDRPLSELYRLAM